MVQIMAKRGRIETLNKDVHILQDLFNDIRHATTEEEANIRAAIVTGYANAMAQHGLLDRSELKDVLQETEEITVTQYEKIVMADELRRVCGLYAQPSERMMKGKRNKAYETIRKHLRGSSNSGRF